MTMKKNSIVSMYKIKCEFTYGEQIFGPFTEAMSILDCFRQSKCTNMHTFIVSARTCIIKTSPVPLSHMGYWIHIWYSGISIIMVLIKINNYCFLFCCK